MIVRTLDEIGGTERDVEAANWTSRRLLLRDDRMGFSLHDTIIHPGTSTEMHYQHHLEAVYCIEGEGQVRVLESGEVYPIRPGTVYALNGHERHVLSAKTRLRLVCVFSPALVGHEVHDESGAYPVVAET